MSEININYKGSKIAGMDASGTKTLLTEGKYCEGNISVEYNKPAAPTPSLQSKTYTVDSAGTETITADSGYDGLSSVQVSVPSATLVIWTDQGFYNDSGTRKWRYRGQATADPEEAGVEGWMGSAVQSGNWYVRNAVSSGTTITPTESAQTIGGQEYMMEGAVTVNAISSSYVGSGITRRDSTDLSASGATVTVPSGYYSAQASKAVASGTAGTPTATKGTVSNHSISVTPSVTNSAGYISGGTHTGTAVSVSASELVSGSQTITSNQTVDVTNLAEVVVNVSGGGGGSTQTGEAYATSTTASISFTGLPSEPTSFFISFVGASSIGLPTGTPYKTIDVVYDGTNDFGNIATNITNAQASYSTNFSHSYSNGTLTVTGTESNFIGYYLMLYTYGGSTSDIHTKDVQVGSGVTSITFTGLEAEPTYWSCAFKSNFGTSSGYQRTIATSYCYNILSNAVNGYFMGTVVGCSATSWTASYNNGSLTITSQGTNAGGYFHQPGYYQLTYAYDDGSSGNYQSKTVTPTTSQQVVEADTGYDALKKVTVNAIPSEYIVPSGNISITSNTATGQTLNVAQYATATVAVPTGGANIATETMTNSSNQNTTISFTLPSGRTPKAFFARLTSQIARNSNSRYYYVFDMRWDGSSTGGVAGNTFYMYNGTLTNVTSGYSYSQSGTTFTLSSTGSRSASPGSFYNGTYELVYIY